MTNNKQQYFELVADKARLENKMNKLGAELTQLNKKMIDKDTDDETFDILIEREDRVYKHRAGIQHRIDRIEAEMKQMRKSLPREIMKAWRTEWREMNPPTGPTPVLISVESRRRDEEKITNFIKQLQK